MTQRSVARGRTPATHAGRPGIAMVVLVLAGPAFAQAPTSPLDNYADAATTTIIAEQSCPGVQMKAGQLTNLRLAARVNTGQEPALQEKLRTRATQVRQQLAEVGRDAWCANALAAFGPEGTVARGVLVPNRFVR
ncbi:hypothetical protein MKK88_32620 [Methylobacterium sp. E-005]|uniref:hypothetical protein n=1 Tax=Methylobacterium sp. E-005 TaxID=2836549 RepID=UPI001FBBC6E6|nr:hypothetical protein [Methylobacterium sp. E-005]MCJ2090692.1 hypothetical protein [Methylobacterium sp. E-005]